MASAVRFRRNLDVSSSIGEKERECVRACVCMCVRDRTGRRGRSSELDDGEMAVARTSENTRVYLPSTIAAHRLSLPAREAIGKARAVVILQQAAMRLLGINDVTVHHASTLDADKLESTSVWFAFLLSHGLILSSSTSRERISRCQTFLYHLSTVKNILCDC